ncbi:uncharacterized protein LDX57_005958 [Aspergillus melleus]|uniref:uncharacterized protein n=1 Tax=Aspergillus melleus TaxID=138277 RepID=UPI001E8CF84E|nr:uncharacterized protein LDX57_005958 [Aspergillus melleus]KAH8428255.1 hypothetical protein LDX57_005958 [Aspergillus melleus]
MQSTKAIVANAPITPGSINWSLQDIQCPIFCGPDEVLVEIVATGLCHTDVFVSGVPDGTLGIRYPKIMGHEGAGYIRSIGKASSSSSDSNCSSHSNSSATSNGDSGATSKFQINDPVLLSFPSCASCTQCKQGHPAHCTGIAAEKYTGRKIFTVCGTKHEDPSIWGSFLGQSSFARYTVVNVSSVFSLRGLLRQSEDLAVFAPLGCSYLTGYGVVQRIARVNGHGRGHGHINGSVNGHVNGNGEGGKNGGGDTVLIMGLGGVGMGAVLATTQSHPQTLIVLDQHAPRLQLAKDLGATHTLNTRSPNFNLQDAVRAICPEGPSVVIDTTGVPELIERGLDVAAPRGRIVLVGVPPVGYVVGMQGLGFVESGKSVMGCLVGDSVPEVDIPQLIQWYYEGRFPIDRLITKVPIEDYEKALRGTEKGEIIKAVLVWDEDQV